MEKRNLFQVKYEKCDEKRPNITAEKRDARKTPQRFWRSDHVRPHAAYDSNRWLIVFQDLALVLLNIFARAVFKYFTVSPFKKSGTSKIRFLENPGNLQGIATSTIVLSMDASAIVVQDDRVLRILRSRAFIRGRQVCSAGKWHYFGDLRTDVKWAISTSSLYRISVII